MSATKPEPGELWRWLEDDIGETTFIFLVLEFKVEEWGRYRCKILTLAGRVGVFSMEVGAGIGCCSLVSEAVKEQNE